MSEERNSFKVEKENMKKTREVYIQEKSNKAFLLEKENMKKERETVNRDVREQRMKWKSFNAENDAKSDDEEGLH